MKYEPRSQEVKYFPVPEPEGTRQESNEITSIYRNGTLFRF